MIPYLTVDSGNVENEEKAGNDENGLYAMSGCVKNIAKGRYWLTPRFLHLFNILSAISLDPLSSGLSSEFSTWMMLSASWILFSPAG